MLPKHVPFRPPCDRSSPARRLLWTCRFVCADILHIPTANNLTTPLAHFSPDIFEIAVVPHHGTPTVRIHGDILDFVSLAGASCILFVLARAGERASGSCTTRTFIPGWGGAQCTSWRFGLCRRPRGFKAVDHRVMFSREKTKRISQDGVSAAAMNPSTATVL